MPVTVSFRGICLFAVKNENGISLLNEVLLPEAEDGKPREADSAGRHLDHSKTKPHYARLWIPGRPGGRIDIKKKTLTITKDGANTGPVATELKHLPTLPNQQLTIDAVARKNRSTSVKILGGTIATKKPRERAFSFEGQTERHDQVNVSFDATVTIKIGSKPIILKPDDNQTVFVYNFDSKAPSRTRLDNGNETDDRVIHDDDFKWHYLLAAPPGPDKNKLALWRNGVLPCPTSVSIETVAGSTCYPAAITES